MDFLKPTYFFRIDDVTPGMNWDNFLRLEKIFDTYDIKPIIGVVPNNKDKKLDQYHQIEDFWWKIRDLHQKWWIIAQHGYEHVYTNQNSGILKINNYSEFAWLPHDKQYEKISAGKKIMESELWFSPKWWMAPAHSFDEITCQVLRELWFEYITDGIAVFPFEKYWLKWLPQQIWKPRKRLFWTWTICLHPNRYDDRFINEIEKFCSQSNWNQWSIQNITFSNWKFQCFLSKIIYSTGFYFSVYTYKFYKKLASLCKFPRLKVKELEKYGWWKSFMVGLFLHGLYIALMAKFRFEPWHTSPIYWRPYALWILRKNFIFLSSEDVRIVEIWCWIWEILKRIPTKNKEGYDISWAVIECAKFLDSSSYYTQGSFPDVEVGQQIQALITVNFIHNVPPQELKHFYFDFVKKHKVLYIIIDEIQNNFSYLYNHTSVEIIPIHFIEVTRSEAFEWGRVIKIFKNSLYE